MSNISNSRQYNRRFDELEAAICNSIGVETDHHEIKIEHVFAPGLYLRKMFMPKHTILTSKIHKTEHPYIVSLGIVKVWSEEYPDGVEIFSPYHGMTHKGTRRIILAYEDTFITTIHPNPDNCEDLEILESRIIKKHVNKLLSIPIKEASQCISQ